MDDLEFRRRVMMNFGASEDKWDGFDFGEILGYWEVSTPRVFPVKVLTTPYIAVTPGHSIRFNSWTHYFSGTNKDVPAIVCYNAEKVYVDWFGQQQNDRIITLGSTTHFVRITVNWDDLSSGYIFDETTGEYLWRGSDYVD